MIRAAKPEIVRRMEKKIGKLTPSKVERFVNSLTPRELITVISDWEMWSLPYQRIPKGNWRRWIFRAGRGTGKTYTGARTVVEVARDKRHKIGRGEIGIIGRTHSDARFTMVEGPSGILNVAPPDFVPLWEPGNGLLTFPNKVRARIYSADKPESIRGPNFSFVWADEAAHWTDLHKTWIEVIEPALRAGWARALITTTPIRDPDLKKIEDMRGSITTRAATFENSFLPAETREVFRDLYEGTAIGRQELYGEILEQAEGALWSIDMIDKTRVRDSPSDLGRVVVAIDPAVTSNEKSDETGIVVAGANGPESYVLADRTMKASPNDWAKRAVALYWRYQADAIVAEVNNGGDLVETIIRSIDSRVRVKSVRASRGKAIRAEPVAALYERGLVHHVGSFPELEEQMTTWEPSHVKSPDRIDALVWALTDLQLTTRAGPLRGYL